MRWKAAGLGFGGSPEALGHVIVKFFWIVMHCERGWGYTYVFFVRIRAFV